MRESGTLFTVFLLGICCLLPHSAYAKKDVWSVGRITVQGNQAVKTNKILGVMETRPSRFWRSSPYSRSKLRFDKRTIEAFYRQQGFLEAEVTVAEVDFDTLDRHVDIAIAITEGKQTTIDTVALIGRTVLDTNELREALACKGGEPFSTLAVQKDITSMTSGMASKGYLKAKVDDGIHVDREERTARVAFSFAQGPLCFTGPLQIQGLEKVRARVVRRELHFNEGDTLTSGSIKKTLRHLYGTGLFDFVQILPSVSDSGNDSSDTSETLTMPVSIVLDETKFFTIDASAGYGTNEHFRASLRTAFANCFGLGHTLALEGKADRFSQRAELSYTFPYFMYLPLRAEAATYVERHDVTYKGLFEGVRIAFTPRLPKRLSYRLWAEYERTDTLYVKESSEFSSDSLQWNTQSLGIDLTLDGRFKSDKGTRGTLVRLEPEIAGLAMQGTNQYYRGLADLRGYFDLTKKVKLSTALSIGYAHVYGEDTTGIPPQARYYIGSEGLRPIRGYPTDTIGGTVAIVINLFELRLPLYKWFGLTLFSDGGGHWETRRDVTKSSMRWVAGPGLSITTPIGELRADFPRRLNGTRGWGSPYFSVGSTF
ncbi:MAG: BamA/TamA family outer membrane protein [Chitinispirillaceae bacterium]|nr:BamA/TamA family outer membrane protein [Chitinispirillaceae bacterium]